MARLMLIALLNVCLLGCATTGGVYDDSKIAQIQKDVTTESQLLEWFGPPVSRAMASDSSRNLVWRFSPARGQTSRSSGTLQVRLGVDGKVSTYSAAAGSK